METKICRTCKQEKLLSEFNKDKRQKDGYATQCKECKHAYLYNYRAYLYSAIC